MDENLIRQWIDFACEQNGVRQLSDSIMVEWNSRFTRRLGDAVYFRSTGLGRIRLSIPLWPRASDQDRRETVIHEACHVIVGYKFCNAPHHGAEWKAAMRACGIKPSRTHEIDRTDLTRKKRLFVVLDCPNPDIKRKCHVGVRLRNRLQKGDVITCRVCALVIDGTAKVEPAEVVVPQPT